MIASNEKQFWLWFKMQNLELRLKALKSYAWSNDEGFLKLAEVFNDYAKECNQQLTNL